MSWPRIEWHSKVIPGKKLANIIAKQLFDNQGQPNPIKEQLILIHVCVTFVRPA